MLFRIEDEFCVMLSLCWMAVLGIEVFVTLSHESQYSAKSGVVLPLLPSFSFCTNTSETTYLVVDSIQMILKHNYKGLPVYLLTLCRALINLLNSSSLA